MDGFRGLSGHQYYNMFWCLVFEHILPKLSKALLLLNVISVGVIVITLFAMSSSRTSVEYFIKVVNICGWPDGVAFIIGSNGANWCFSCLGVATHLAEEIPSPGTNMRKALIWTIVIASRSGLLRVLAVLVNLDPGDTTDYSGIAIF